MRIRLLVAKGRSRTPAATEDTRGTAGTADEAKKSAAKADMRRINGSASAGELAKILSQATSIDLSLGIEHVPALDELEPDILVLVDPDNHDELIDAVRLAIENLDKPQRH